ncbi:hypothetical protein HK100_005844 [Physocladia obscura]|uniref:FAD/NAD(P)-binding domain-containing protein n=1 Tax=Physocladia obscura TaxID=109957 RepID=A0AAD5SWT9_9FUNG|nr:hypothetical protein HK100_005844 [Physocladia obscura]
MPSEFGTNEALKFLTPEIKMDWQLNSPVVIFLICAGGIFILSLPLQCARRKRLIAAETQRLAAEAERQAAEERQFNEWLNEPPPNSEEWYRRRLTYATELANEQNRLAEEQRQMGAGAFAGARAADILMGKLKNKANVILVDERDSCFIAVQAMLPLFDPKKVDQIWVPYSSKSLLFWNISSGNVIQGSAVKLNENSLELHDGRTISFDFAVIATGTKSALKPPVWNKTEGQNDAENLTTALLAAKNISVIGGGQVGVELAAKLCSNLPETHVHLIHRGPQLLSKMAGMNDASRQKVYQVLQKFTNLTISLEDSIAKPELPLSSISTEKQILLTKSGREINSDVTFMTTGNLPNSKFVAAGLGESLLDDGGYIRTAFDGSLIGYSHIFAAGDVSNLDPVKLARQAMNQAQLVASNIEVLVKSDWFGEVAKIDPKPKLKIYTPVSRDNGAVKLGKQGFVVKLWGFVLHI